MLDNTPRWTEIECIGERTGIKYYGRFCIKRYLTHKENGDVSRLAENYSRGISEDIAQKGLMFILAQLAFHITETDAKWWTDSEKGLEMVDEEPAIVLIQKVRELQQEWKKKDEPKDTPQVST